MSTRKPLVPNIGVTNISPYVQGQSQIEGVKEPIKLSSNESSHGPCAAAIEAYNEAAQQLNRYADGSQTKLRLAIGEVHGLNPEQILCGNGSDEIIQLMVRAYVSEGDEVLLSQNGFIMANIHSLAQGAKLVIAPENSYRVDVDALLSRVTSKTTFCTIANPNNPTGTYLPDEEMRRLHAGLPENCLLLIDNAYAEYVTKSDFSDGAALVDENENVVMTRTFSKIYGLPSLRIGWAYCSSTVAGYINRIRTPFNTNGPALATAAAAVEDQAYIAEIRQHNQESLELIERELSQLGIEVIPSVANFYLIRFDPKTGKSGAGADQFLQSCGIIPRPTGGSDEFLRVTVGLDHENKAVIDALNNYMQQ